jgi:hypothetical protein
MKKRSLSRLILGFAFAVIALTFLLTVAAQTYGQVCGGVLHQCGVASFLMSYSSNVGSFFVTHESAVEAFGTLCVAVFTFTLWSSTEQLAAMAAGQGDAMERSIKEAAKAAATNAIADATKANASLMEGIMHRQMRAYITVEAGPGVYQDNTLVFGSFPILNNAGFTPARNVSYQVMASILNTNLPDDFRFETYGNRVINDVTIAPRQVFHITAKVRERFPDVEVDEIMQGHSRRLYIWGTVTYEDVFGGSWQTNFCHNFIFLKGEEGNPQVRSFFHNRHNNAT